METFDAIVLGAGGVGSAALDALARRGLRTLGIDRFQPPHDRGSSHGHTRVIRQAYFEHPDYVPLLLESYRLWRALEERSGRRLLHQIGLVEIGPADGVVVPGVIRAATEHALSVERLTAAEIELRWPGIRAMLRPEALPPAKLHRVVEQLTGVFEPTAGYLLVEDCVAAQLQSARAAGATLLANTEVHTWTADARGVRVRTSAGEFAAARLIIAAGPWAMPLLADLRLQLTVRRKSLFWFATDSPHYEVASGFPVFLFELPDGVFYGFPQLDPRGIKVAEHTGGAVVADPLAVDRAIDAIEQRRLQQFLAAHLPHASHRVTDHAVCLYTMSPDEHFIVDRHPRHPHVVFAAGLSGHGFKFTPVLGQALADLALTGQTNLPTDFLSLGRFPPPSPLGRGPG